MTRSVFIIGLACVLQIYMVVTVSQILTVDPPGTSLPKISKGTQSTSEVDVELDAEETFRHPAFLIHGNPILGFFQRNTGHRPLAQLPAGTLLTYSPPLSPMLRPVSTRFPDSSSSVSELPSSWSPLVAPGNGGDKISSGSSASAEVEENKSEESRSDASPARPSNDPPSLPPPPPPPTYLYPQLAQRPMLPYRHPGFMPQAGLPNRGFGMIKDHGTSELIPKEIKETIRSVETSDEVKASEASAKATFIQTNWIALISSLILLISAALGVVGYFVWKGRIGDIPVSTPPLPTSNTAATSN